MRLSRRTIMSAAALALIASPVGAAEMGFRCDLGRPGFLAGLFVEGPDDFILAAQAHAVYAALGNGDR